MSRITGADRHSRRLLRMAGPGKNPGLYAALFAGGNRIETSAEISITQGSISGKGHVPSRPGEPPNADTRLLDTSIDTTGDPSRMRVRVTSHAPHAFPLEWGTSKMEARPSMRPAAHKERGAVAQLVAKAYSIFVRKG